MEKTKLLIDMDIGDDIDDALALYLAMRDGIEIVGITTVFGNTVERARIAKKMLTLFGSGYENVPVYAGCGEGSEHLCQYTPDIDNDSYAPNGTGAVDFIIDSCKKYGKELKIVAIGPFTNIAAALERDKDVFDAIDSVVIMGGAYYKQYADWNVMCDVRAADVMFRNIKNLECIGADVTHRLAIGRENSERLLRLRGEVGKYLSELYRLWLDWSKKECAVLHDPLAIYYAMHPDVCKMETAAVAVITEGYARGLTLNADAYSKAYLNSAFDGFNLAKKVKVAYDIDEEKFVDLFMDRMCQK